MNITNELLKHLDVDSMILVLNKQNSNLCFLRQQNRNIWTLVLASPCNFSSNTTVQLQITFINKKSFSIPVSIIETGFDYCKVILPKQIKNETLKSVISTLYDLEFQDEKYGRRKEQRIDITKENYKNFGLNSLQQKIVFNSLRTQQPCAILNASIHGMCVISEQTNALKKCDNFLVILEFEQNPNVIMQLHKVYSRTSKLGDKVYTSLSCQILEPIHFLWKQNVINLIKSNPLE